MPGYLAYILPIDQGAHPEHPIAPGGSPPGFWGPNDPRPTPPIHLPGGGAGGGSPPGFWGPNDPRPTPPINLPPGVPPGYWGPNDPRPTPPIVIPPELPPVEPPQGGGDKPPPQDGGWGYVSDAGFGWGYFPAQADKPNPPSGPGTGQPPAVPTQQRR